MHRSKKVASCLDSRLDLVREVQLVCFRLQESLQWLAVHLCGIHIRFRTIFVFKFRKASWDKSRGLEICER